MWFRRIRENVKAFGRRVQAVVVRVALFFVYLIGLGAARGWAALFHRTLLSPRTGGLKSYWLETSGQPFDEEDSMRQS